MIFVNGVMFAYHFHYAFNSNLVWDSLNCLLFLIWTWASVRKSAPTTSSKPDPTQPIPNDHPNQLLAVSSIHPRRLPKLEKIITAKHPHAPDPNVKYPIPWINFMKNCWSGPAHRKNTNTAIIERKLPMKHNVKKNWVAIINGGSRNPLISSYPVVKGSYTHRQPTKNLLWLSSLTSGSDLKQWTHRPSLSNFAPVIR